MEYMSDTLFIEGKKKRTKSTQEVFEKIQKSIKKKGPTSKWECIIDEQRETLLIDFHDDESETFDLHFDEKGSFLCICKLFLPVDENGTEVDYTLMNTLLDIFYKIKASFSNIKVRDDYAQAEGYWDNKRIKYELRTLSFEEEQRLNRLYNEGYKTHESFLRALMAEDLEMPYDKFEKYYNPRIDFRDIRAGWICISIGSYLYETAEFKNEGRLCDMDWFTYYDLGRVSFSEYAFECGMSWLFFDGTGPFSKLNTEKQRAFSPKDAQERVAPLFQAEVDPYQRCVLAYRYWLTIYEGLGFRFVGRKKTHFVFDDVFEEYGDEMATRLLTVYCSWRRYLVKTLYPKDTHEQYKQNFVENCTKRYGKDFLNTFVEFKRKYEKIEMFGIEAGYFSECGDITPNLDGKYLDKSLFGME